MSDTSLSLIVIRSPDIDRAADFYSLLGFKLDKHRHGNGPVHYSADLGATAFEIYPSVTESDGTASVRLGFRVASLEGTISSLRDAGVMIVSEPQASDWGRRAVIDDLDGHRIELTELAPHV